MHCGEWFKSHKCHNTKSFMGNHQSKGKKKNQTISTPVFNICLFPQKKTFSHKHKATHQYFQLRSLEELALWSDIFYFSLYPLLQGRSSSYYCQSRNPEIFYKPFVSKNNQNEVYHLHREGHYLSKNDLHLS